MTNEQLRNLRIAAGLSIGELARASGVNENAIRNIEAGRTRRIQMRTARRLAPALAISVADLLAGQTAEDPDALADELVADWPALTPAQRDRLRTLLGVK